MFHHLSSEGIHILLLAQKEASHSGSSHVILKHLLCALLISDKGIACEVLREHDITLDKARDNREPPKVKDNGLDSPPFAFSEATAKCLEDAWSEAQKLGDEEVSGVHLLLAMVRMKLESREKEIFERLPALVSEVESALLEKLKTLKVRTSTDATDLTDEDHTAALRRQLDLWNRRVEMALIQGNNDLANEALNQKRKYEKALE